MTDIRRSAGYEPRFDIDVKVGQRGEDYVENIIAAVLESNGRIEVKTDERALETGNVYIEFQCNGRPSGPLTSQADLFAFVFGRVVAIVPRHVLIYLVLKGQQNGWERSMNRGSHPTRGVCYPLGQFLFDAVAAEQAITNGVRR